MKKLARLLHTDNKYLMFHIVALSCFLLGFFIALTAGEMGPFAPLLISFGLYFTVFALLLEGMFLGLALLRRATARWV